MVKKHSLYLVFSTGKVFLDLWSWPVRKTSGLGGKSGPWPPPGWREPVCPLCVSEQLFLDSVGIDLYFQGATSQLHYHLWSWCRPPFNQTQPGPNKTWHLLKTNHGRGGPLPVTPVVSPSTLMSWQHLHGLILQKQLFCMKCCVLGLTDLVWNVLYGEEKLLHHLALASKERLSSRESDWSVLMFSWEICLPWNRNLKAMLPHSLWVFLVAMSSRVAGEKVFELLNPRLQDLGKLMSLLLWHLSLTM